MESNKSALGAVSEYMEQQKKIRVPLGDKIVSLSHEEYDELMKATLKADSGWNDAFNRMKHKNLKEAIEETDNEIVGSCKLDSNPSGNTISQSDLAMKWLLENMDKLNDIIENHVSKDSESIDDKVSDPANNITLDSLPSEFTVSIVNTLQERSELHFQADDTDFYDSELRNWGIQFGDIEEDIHVISNQKQTVAMNDYFEMIQDIVPADRYNSTEVNEYNRNIIRPMFLFRKVGRDDFIKYPPIFEKLSGKKSSNQFMYLYTQRYSVSPLNMVKMLIITKLDNIHESDRIICKADNYRNDVYIGFPMWLSLMYKDIIMMEEVMNNMSFLEKIIYRKTIRIMKRIIQAFKASFT